MEYCPYCQRYVEPKKGHADWIGGGLVGGPIGLAVGATHYYMKVGRCPICNMELHHQGGAVPPQSYRCQRCGQPLLWNPQFQRWFCSRCGA